MSSTLFRCEAAFGVQSPQLADRSPEKEYADCFLLTGHAAAVSCKLVQSCVSEQGHERDRCRGGEQQEKGRHEPRKIIVVSHSLTDDPYPRRMPASLLNPQSPSAPFGPKEGRSETHHHSSVSWHDT